MRQHWNLDPEVRFLNHGSFGATPRVVLEHQQALRDRMEREPMRFLWVEIEERLDEVRRGLGAFLNAPPEDLVFVNNATSGVNAVLRSFPLSPGDELLVTSHGYNACCNAARFVAERAGATVREAPIPFPLEGPDVVMDAVLDAVGERTRLVLIDHVTSATGLILPLERLLPALRERGVRALVDAAHAPGMLDVDIEALAPDYYTGNCHKWICAPKGAAFLYVRPELQPEVRPTVISHGANSPREDRSRFQLEFDWVGTDDPTAFLCIPKSIEVLGGLYPGGWGELRERNRAKAVAARELLCAAVGVAPPAPESMIGSLAAVPLNRPAAPAPAPQLFMDPLYDRLFHEHRITTVLQPWPAPVHRILRVSAQAYTEPADFEELARVLPAALAATSQVP